MVKRIAFLGPVGTFGWRVASQNNLGATLLPCASHAEVMRSVIRGKADLGYVARENSLGGTVVDTVDPFLRNPVGINMSLEKGRVVYSPGDLILCGEVVLPIEQCLYGHNNDREVKRVYSHQQALSQCREFISIRFPEAELIPADSTVSGVAKLQEDICGVAIAPPWAGEFYPDISLLEKAIQDSRVNDTRFLVVGREECAPTGMDKTSLWFTVPEDEKPGTFDSVSQILALANINKRSIETRPMQTELGKYIFLVDVDGHRRDRIIELALELIVLAGHTTTLTILGSYPRWQNGV
ncbi:MAG TPA: prephenate dehydratase domain-containing protein [Candidatus Paceibacterota bacterium]